MHLFPDISVWILLSLAIIAILLKKRIWGILFALSIMLACFLGILALKGLIIIAVGIAVVFYGRGQKGWRHYLCHGLFIVWSILLIKHMLPGFNNLKVINEAVTGADSAPFSMYFNIDKPMVIFASILFVPNMFLRPQSANAKFLLTLSATGLILLPLLGYMLGLIRPEFSIPSWIGLFLWDNLLLTSICEEVFFRGYLQTVLSKFGPMIAITISSVLFGLMHCYQGIDVIILATVAGVFYGAIYFATGRLYLAIIAHFLFNLYYLIFFTYPVVSG